MRNAEKAQETRPGSRDVSEAHKIQHWDNIIETVLSVL